jgi:hypothetical protein
LLVCGPIFEPGTSKILRSVKHSTTTFNQDGRSGRRRGDAERSEKGSRTKRMKKEMVVSKNKN